MADEITTVPEEQALFQLSNGRYIMDEAQSRVMFQIKEAQPEHSHPISGTGYSWDESGMAELFSECYKNDTRYCPEAKSWFTYSEGAWRKDTGSLLVAEKIKEFCRLMALYCGEIANEERRSEYMKFIVKMGDRRFRDRLMKDYDAQYPQYGFAVHKGYGTKRHYAALREYGPCPIHRQTFLKKFYAGT